MFGESLKRPDSPDEVRGLFLSGDPIMIGWVDVDGNGVIDLNDFNQVRKNLGRHLP
jgi:hypothetical protein